MTAILEKVANNGKIDFLSLNSQKLAVLTLGRKVWKQY